MARDAASAFRGGRNDEASEIITKSRPLIDRLLSASRPTLAAMQAISDLDEIYGQMLVRNRNYVWARDVFQKNVTRWKFWTPSTPETVRRLAEARAAVADCDRHMQQP